MSDGYTVAILGATGAVGTRLIQQLEQSTIPVSKVKLLASVRSAGKKLQFKGQDITVEEAKPDSFTGVDIVLASAGGAVSKKLLPEAVKRGAVCVDNTSAFRMEENVPLVVPEVNEKALYNHHGIIANPNCSTIQMMVALEPIRKTFGLKQIIVSTYQAASGAGQSALDELYTQAQEYLDGKDMKANIFPTKGDKEHYPLAFNLLPQIDVLEDNLYSHEEWKMIHETKKIMLGDMNSSEIKVTATCVRVPVPISHGESIYIEVEDQSATVEQIQELIRQAPGAVLQDDPKHQVYPQPINAVGKRDTFVGRIRPDLENKGAFNMWVVSDNLLKGAAWNTVQIAERLVADDLVHVK
ncbi:aspartate-semialdehyde dehydrogenase [Companilactobacillus alimentarius]|uniref:Aspartate-semialdehyde dehydrogenase n=1 Tax=Companilactobacillus alimentarius DSM 20249 TaxID=1423720 RepID=A0A2K9HIJ9_9LACO|nr:aspartate-semialdehyde dehydrogenase [Companilactobacillus alimentarius]AUI71527.1 aspartate-semialdehyde dehydrogenase [Companilactobacillus alimentarius DSM 20249]KRK74561.1 aspartate-semialdehyde dehydrogenase [Companilactobacillus alimentarius DSM 20249]GEO44533.1 aspartate-semialdehyde dehydrogenase [Companilactobacillus alimentarius]